MAVPSIIISAPTSGAGKTTITLGILRALANKGLKVSAAKVGPDYIDSKFHEKASGGRCVNLDSWAMNKSQLHYLANEAAENSDLFLIEGVMGLFDGALQSGESGNGSTASVAIELGIPVILVIDASAQAQSVAALAHGFRDLDKRLDFAGVILNRVRSQRHGKLMESALSDSGIKVFGMIPSNNDLSLPSRHLGLVQADELKALEQFIQEASRSISINVDLDAIKEASNSNISSPAPANFLKPLGRHIAVARDIAFNFTYNHILGGWTNSGVKISYFSPLNNEGPDVSADAVYLPGGYPELHAEKISKNTTFLNGLRKASEAGKWVYGECGGFMVLGKTLTDASGTRFPMSGLLDLQTSFENPKLSLGYRQGKLTTDCPFGIKGQVFRSHEFHYACITSAGGDSLFSVQDSSEELKGSAGLVKGSVFGSFLHII